MGRGVPAGLPLRTGPVAGVVLAAGSSTRMGTPKALLDADGATFLARLGRTLRRGGCDPVVVVAAAQAGPVAAEAEQAGARLAVNPGGEGGQIGSLRAAISHLGALDDPPAAFLFTPVDNPAVASETVRAVIRGWECSQAAIVAPSYQGKRGHPVLADMAIANEFLDEGLADGARTVVRRDPARVLEVPVPDPHIADDIDTPQRYADRFPGEGQAAREASATAPDAPPTAPDAPPGAPQAPPGPRAPAAR
ncbi:MAG: nucleotidyltransferase family protein [Gemmatimonadetes bacterium]|nr:nucleotidyltransferase family protein [Gemmatimonadota bacterium]